MKSALNEMPLNNNKVINRKIFYAWLPKEHQFIFVVVVGGDKYFDNFE